MEYDLKIENIDAATMTAKPYGSSGSFEPSGSYGLIKDAAVLVSGGVIIWAGKRKNAPYGAVAETVDGKGGLLTPGLIDCHTHLVYGKDRASEFEERLKGTTCAEILTKGGGILSTVRSTRAASKDELATAALSRLARLMREGVTTVEIKSGYGLDLKTEGTMIEAMKAVEKKSGITVKKTFLGAHALPPEYANDSDGYVDAVCGVMIPAFAKDVDFVDVFCEKIAFTSEQTLRVFKAAAGHGLRVKIHAEQLSNTGAAALASRYNAVSADHLEYIDEAGVKAMAASGTTAVLLPGAFYFLRETTVPPVGLFRKHGVPMAVATDSNPGSSPCLSLLLMLNMACILFNLTPEEALTGVTLNAAKALGMEKEIGTIEPGKYADLALFDVKAPGELAYSIGGNPCIGVWKKGRRV